MEEMMRLGENLCCDILCGGFSGQESYWFPECDYKIIELDEGKILTGNPYI